MVMLLPLGLAMVALLPPLVSVPKPAEVLRVIVPLRPALKTMVSPPPSITFCASTWRSEPLVAAAVDVSLRVLTVSVLGQSRPSSTSSIGRNRRRCCFRRGYKRLVVFLSFQGVIRVCLSINSRNARVAGLRHANRRAVVIGPAIPIKNSHHLSK
jgi:hypothetical protein